MRWMRLAAMARRRRFGTDTRGVAVVEFALILPLLLLLFVGSIEASTLITVDRRVNTIAGSIGDLVARWDVTSNGPISSSTLTDYFQAAQGIMFPYSTSALRQVVSLIEVNKTTGETKVLWSCGYNGGTPKATNATYPSLPPKMKELAQGAAGTAGYVVAAEVVNPHVPMLGIVYETAINLRSESFYLPRYGQNIPGPASC